MFDYFNSLDNLSKMSHCQLWKRRRLCVVILSRSGGNRFFFSHVEHLKLRFKEVCLEIVMGYKTNVSVEPMISIIFT